MRPLKRDESTWTYPPDYHAYSYQLFLGPFSGTYYSKELEKSGDCTVLDCGCTFWSLKDGFLVLFLEENQSSFHVNMRHRDALYMTDREACGIITGVIEMRRSDGRKINDIVELFEESTRRLEEELRRESKDVKWPTNIMFRVETQSKMLDFIKNKY